MTTDFRDVKTRLTTLYD